MYTPEQLCKTIRSVYPDVGACGENIKTCFDPDNMAWVVQLKHGNRKLSTYVDPEDATPCMDGKQCLSLGLQIFQLKDNLGFRGGSS
ncbi:MAG: hypothetical protein MI863_04820 [Desulfobacterales bacterium]|nr:hypothetical protein [Desulfobacterales bacterium]